MTPMTSGPLSRGTPSITRMPISHRIGFATVVGSTRVRRTGSFRAAIAPANPRPTAIRTPCRTSSSSPHAGARDQEVRTGIPQQHGRGVGDQRRPHAIEQFDEHVVDVQARQLGVGHSQQMRQLISHFRVRH